MNEWGPTIVQIICSSVLGVVAYFYISQQDSRDDKLKDLIKANRDVADSQVKSQIEMIKGLHELSMAVGHLKQALEHITIDAEKASVEIHANLNRHEEEIMRLRSFYHGLTSQVASINLRHGDVPKQRKSGS